MKINLKVALTFIVASLVISTTYLNCAGQKYVSPNALENKLEEFSLSSCGNGAYNPSGGCTINSESKCLNLAEDPPNCKTNAASICMNGGTLESNCTLSSTGACVMGGIPPDCHSTADITNPNNPSSSSPVDCSNPFSSGKPECSKTEPPTSDGSTPIVYQPPASGETSTCKDPLAVPPSCLVGKDGLCRNGNTNPPECTQVPTVSVFDVFVESSGVLSSKNVKISMSFDQADIGKTGGTYLILKQSNGSILVCTNPCTPTSTWVKWDENINSKDWTISGLTPIPSSKTTVINSSFDLTSLGGSVVYAGYGIGSTSKEAIQNMFNHKTASRPYGYYEEVLTIPKQEVSFDITGTGTLLNYYINAIVTPSYLDYGKPGYFFVYVANPNSATPEEYLWSYNDSLKKYEWIKWDGKAESAKAYKYDPAIKNEAITIVSNFDVTPYKNWKVVVGYGLGNDVVTAAKDCLDNGKHNGNPVYTPFFIPSY